MAATTATRATIGNPAPITSAFPLRSLQPGACIAGNRERQRFALQTAVHCGLRL